MKIPSCGPQSDRIWVLNRFTVIFNITRFLQMTVTPVLIVIRSDLVFLGYFSKEILEDPHGSCDLSVSIKELRHSVDYIDWKQNFYDEVLSSARPYVSNLIRTEE